MSKVFYFLSFIVFLNVFSCRNSKGNNLKPLISFEDTVINIGNIKLDTEYPCKFIFKNVGNEKLKITKVVGDCGCLNIRWASKPIVFNETDTIFVSFKITEKGKFRKTISINSNTESIFNLVSIQGIAE